ncbi:MAG: response regulator [Desulfobacterales bacterium]|nr:response regulator [Desulfobacterales bacterium]
MHPYQIMFVDDEADFLSSVQRGLRKEPYKVITARSGEAALEKIRTGSIDLVVSDYKMPGMDGLALLRKIREENERIQSIMITAVSDVNITVEALHFLGVSKFFLKPIDIDQLKPVLLQVLQEKGNADETRRCVPEAPGHSANVFPTAGTDPETDYWPAFYHGPVAQCPFCRTGVCFRIPRKVWMKLIPLLMRMRCRTCGLTFFKMGRG